MRSTFSAGFRHSVITMVVLGVLSHYAWCDPSPTTLKNKIPLHEKTFDNGLVALVEEHPGSGLVALNIRFLAGSATEDDLCGYGVSHLLEHLMIRSTQKHPQEGDVEKMIKSLGGTFNATTSADTVSVYIAVPRTALDDALDLILDMALTPNLNDDAIEKEKQVVRKEILLYADNPDARVNESLWRAAFDRHPYAHPILGYPQLFDALTPADVRRSFARFTPNRAVLAVVGDVVPEDIFAAIEQRLDHMPLSRYNPTFHPYEPERTVSRQLQEPFDVDLARLSMGFRSPGVLNEDLFALDLLAVILGQGQAARLQQKLVQDRHLAQSLRVSNDTLLDHGVFTFAMILKPEMIDEVIAVVHRELAKIQTQLITKDELKRAQRLLLSSYIGSRASVEAIASALSLEKLLTGDARFSNTYIQKLTTITAHDIQRVARRYFSPGQCIYAKLLPKSFLPDAAKSPLQNRRDQLPWQTSSLNKGITLAAVENTLTPTASLTVLFRAGLLAESSTTNGLSKICGQMLLRSKKAGARITTLLEEKGATVRPIIDDNSLGLHVDMLRDDLPYVVEIIASILKNPSFTKQDFTNVQQNSLLDIQVENDNMFSYGFNKLRAALYQDHPYARSLNGTRESVSALTLNDLTRFYDRLLREEHIIIAVAGDYPPQESLRLLTQAFAKMRPTFHSAPMTDLPLPPDIIPQDITLSLDRQGAVLLFGWKGLRGQDPEIFNAEVLSSIMSGHSGRFLHNIRNKNHLTYIQQFSHVPNFLGGFFVAYAGTSVQNQQRVKNEITAQLRLLADQGVSEQEITDAKLELMTRHLARKQHNSFLSSRMAQLLLMGIDPQWLFQYDHHLLAVTQDSVNAFVQRVLAGQPHVEILITSENQEN